MITFYYDLARNPPTYDSVTAALRFEMERLRLGEEKIAIEILPGSNRGFRKDTVWPRNPAVRRELLNNIVVPMFSLLPCVCRVTVHSLDKRSPGLHGFGVNDYLIPFNHFVIAMRRGIRPLRPLKEVLVDPNLITMTLRECEHYTARNSQVVQWLCARGELLDLGYDVIVIPDTFKVSVTERVTNEYGALAAKDLHKRAELYSRAACNLFVGNGPAWFSYALDAPTVVLRPVTDCAGYLYSAAAFTNFGIPKGGQIPGTGDKQRLVWEDDTADNIVKAATSFMSRYDKKEAVKETQDADRAY